MRAAPQHQQALQPTRKDASAASRQSDPLPGLQRSIGNQGVLRLLERTGGHSLPRDLPAVFSRVRDADPQVGLGAGEQLSDEVRAEMESRFGADFGDVRVHADACADTSAAHQHAVAYTVERDIVFSSGQYAPHTASGKQLLAHELMHVLQQPAASGLALTKGQNEALEPDANRAATAVKSGAPIAGPAVTSAAPVVARQEAVTEEKGLWATLRDRALAAMVRESDEAIARDITKLRGLAAHLPGELFTIADTLLSVVDALLHTVLSIFFFALGTIVGFIEGLVDMIWGAVILLAKIFEFIIAIFNDIIVTILRGFGIDRMAWPADRSASMLIAARDALINLPSSIRTAYDRWAVEYRSVPPERKAFMLGQLFGQVLAIVATSGAAAARAGKIATIAERAAPAFEVGALGEATAPRFVFATALGPKEAALLGGAAPVAAKGAQLSASEAESQKRINKLQKHAEKELSGKKNKNLKKEPDPTQQASEPRKPSADELKRDPSAQEIVDEAEGRKGTSRRGEGAAIGSTEEAAELAAWEPKIKAEGYTEIYTASESFRGADWLKRTFRRGGPDMVAVDREAKRILVGDVTSEFANRIPNEFGAGDRLHIEKTIEYGNLIRDLIATMPEFANFVIEVQERYWRTGAMTKRIRITR